VATRAQLADPLRARTGGYRKRLARRLGLRLRDLDGVSWEALEHYCRCKAAQSVLDPRDDPERAMRAANATHRAWVQLERRLREVGLDRGRRDGVADLADHLRANYGNGSVGR